MREGTGRKANNNENGVLYCLKEQGEPLKIKGGNQMNKTDLINKVSEKTGSTKKDAESQVNAILDVIEETLAAGDDVQLIGFGTFEARERAERTGRNPQTGEEITIPAGKVPAFKAGKALKDAVKA